MSGGGQEGSIQEKIFEKCSREDFGIRKIGREF